jgi:hypothetical protein
LALVSYSAVTTSAGTLAVKTVHSGNTIPANDWHPNRQRIDGTSDNMLAIEEIGQPAMSSIIPTVASERHRWRIASDVHRCARPYMRTNQNAEGADCANSAKKNPPSQRVRGRVESIVKLHRRRGP